MAPEPVSVVINGVIYVPKPGTDKPDTVVPATDPVKQSIVNTYSDVKIEGLKKVVSHDMKNIDKIGKHRVLTLEHGKQVMFNGNSASFYIVSKDDNQQIKKVYVENLTDDVENGTIFNKYEVYVDTTHSENNVFEPTIISGGGSRKKYRKSSRRVTSAKKSSRSRKFRNRK